MTRLRGHYLESHLQCGTNQEDYAQKRSGERCLRRDNRTCNDLKASYPNVTYMFAYDEDTGKCKDFGWEYFSYGGACGAFFDFFYCHNTCTPHLPAPSNCFAEAYYPCQDCVDVAYYYNHTTQKCRKYFTKAEPWFPPEGANCFGNRQECKRHCRGFTASQKNSNH
ncbi:uncharacterized protein LOC142564882 isoform X2 [Dermacentor variabilis]|uniref:uncharacterized protein LOC142564882 isoform X2 n=1 Tax=Dermacentor variabilis TaxID=34621 RepID=UPI003F5BB108